MWFDGRDDYRKIDDDDLDVTEYSLAFWFRADYPHEGIQSLLARGESPDDKAQWIVQLNAEENPTRLQLWYEDENDHDYVFATETVIVADRWYHFAATRSADGEVRIYLDGRLELAQAATDDPASIDSPVLLGARNNAPYRVQEYFDGALEAVTVHGTVLSPYQINKLMLSTVPAESPGRLVFSHPGPIELDGVDDYLLIPDRPSLRTNEYTIALSFQADSPNYRTQSLIARGEDWADDKAQWVVELNDQANRGAIQLWYEERNDRDHYFGAEEAIRAGKWYHLVVSRSAEGRVAIYLDGQLVHESVDLTTPAKVATPVLIGARRNSPGKVQDFFDGTIEDILIYNEALGHEEIIDLIPPPRLVLESPVDGQTYSSGEIDLDVSFDRPLTDVSYSLNGGETVSLMRENWVYQEDPDATSFIRATNGAVTFTYDKPEWAVAARWQYKYATADGVYTVVDEVPQSAWDYRPDSVSTRVLYHYADGVSAQAYTGFSATTTLRCLGANNPGGSGDDVGTLFDGNWGTGAAYHRGAERWLTGVADTTTYVQFYDEAIWWDIRLVEDAISGTITAPRGLNTLTISGTDTLGKTTRRTVTFTVDQAAVANGDFETGSLGPWVLTDSGAVVTSDLFTPAIPPAGGTYMGYITTGMNELPSDLHFTDLDGNGVVEREYSALAIEIFTPSAATVEVDLNFLTSEIMPNGTVGASDLLGVTTGAITDTAAYKLLFVVAPTDGSYTGTAAPLTANDFSDEYIQDNPFGRYSTIFDTSVFHGQTGFHRYTFALEAGRHILTFFVADSFTDGGATAMLIDNLTVTL